MKKKTCRNVLAPTVPLADEASLIFLHARHKICSTDGNRDSYIKSSSLISILQVMAVTVEALKILLQG